MTEFTTSPAENGQISNTIQRGSRLVRGQLALYLVDTDGGAVRVAGRSSRASARSAARHLFGIRGGRSRRFIAAEVAE